MGSTFDLAMDVYKKIAEEILQLYTTHGHEDYIGEPVSQIEHMSQAAQLAINEGYDDEIVLASFFHDIGHLISHHEKMSGYGNLRHEQLGAAYLREKGFSERIASLVEGHVQAKRYLTYRYPEYLSNLSHASRQTLAFQGGVMTSDEAAAFERHPEFTVIIQMRKWDEQAKEIEIPILDLTVLKKKIQRVLRLAASASK